MQANINHLVVDTKLATGIMPGNIASLLRDVTLKDEFRVNGGVYAYNLVVNGVGTVTGPVLVRREITLHPPEEQGKMVLFLSGLAAGVSVLTRVSDQKQHSPVHDREFTPLIIRGDVIAPSVSLENTVVAGNIHCDEAVIKDSIIIGVPYVRDTLRLENVVLLSYDAGEVRLFGRNTLLLPYAISRNSAPNFDDEVTRPPEIPEDRRDKEAAADANVAWMRYFGLCYTKYGCGEDAIICDRHRDGSCPYAPVRMNSEDVYPTREGTRSGHALTMAPRMLDLPKLSEEIKRVSQFVYNAQMYDHFDDSAKKWFLKDSIDSEDAMIRFIYRIIRAAFDDDKDKDPTQETPTNP